MLTQTWKTDQPTNLEGDAILQDVYERGKAFGYPFNEVFASIPFGTKVWHNRSCTWPTEPWDGKGFVTLAGDDAHPMTFRKPKPLPSFQHLLTKYQIASDFLTDLQAMKSHAPSNPSSRFANTKTPSSHVEKKQYWPLMKLPPHRPKGNRPASLKQVPAAGEQVRF